MPCKLQLIIRSAELILIGAGVLAIFLSGCSKVPPPPQGQLCEFSASRYESVCRQIVVTPKDGTVAPGQATTYVPAMQMQGWIATDPQSWAEISAYIQKLKALIQNDCK